MAAGLSRAARALVNEMFPETGSEMDALRSAVQTIQLPPEQVVFRRGDHCKGYLVVISGCVRVQVISTNGREVLLYKVNDRESCVITTSCLISQDAYPAEGVTEIETDALVLKQPVFDQALASSATFRRFVFASQGQRLSDLILRLEDVVFERLDVRLARWLVEHSQDGASIITTTHQQLASELGSVREVVSRQLKAFEHKGWISLSRGAIDVRNIHALAAILDESTK
ncbi:MAG: Crp/Fnr family transcriptional regulator [Gammaproteobacteria bacterium]